MSLMGQKRRFERRPITSGLPPTPDILSVGRHVSKVPQTEVSNSPRIPHHALPGVARGDTGELALEGGRRRSHRQPRQKAGNFEMAICFAFKLTSP
jgi:hypothetical protein